MKLIEKIKTLKDEIKKLTSSLEHHENVLILELLASGYTPKEIARYFAFCTRHMNRLIARAKEDLDAKDKLRQAASRYF